MPRPLHFFDPPDRFLAGTVGQPGDRVFFLQARAGAHVVSVSLEKQQVQVLAERVEGLLDEVVRRSGGSAAVPGFGGVLDVFDSLLFAAPVAYGYWVVFGP